MLHLTGYDLSMDDIRNFRQLGSRTPGHPECDVTPGVEMTTGPLGQGISSAVGMALAEKMLATRFNTPEHTVIDHHTYVFLGDGCLMEGVSHEACSLAGVWGLGKLIALYDSNGISIDGKIDGWFTEDVAARYKAYGWQVIGPVDGHDAEALDAALAEARAAAASDFEAVQSLRDYWAAQKTPDETLLRRCDAVLQRFQCDPGQVHSGAQDSMPDTPCKKQK